MFKERFISAVVLVIAAAITLYFGGAVTCAVMCAVSIIGAFELLRVYKLEKSHVGVICYVAIVVYYALLFGGLQELVLPWIIVTLLAVLSDYVLTFPKLSDKDALAAFVSFMYVGVMLSYVYLIRDMENGLILVLMIFVSSWGNDTCAYLVGRAIGKHKMSPILSPKKSVEGLIGGIVGAGLLGLAFGAIYNANMAESANIWLFAFIGAVCALPAVVGDLAASAIKRNNDIKDYGKLIPGHGGIMDRFDSIIFVAPIMYYLIVYLL